MSAAVDRLEDAVADLLAASMTRDTTPAEAMAIVASAVARTLVAYGNTHATRALVTGLVHATRDQRPEDVAATLRDVADRLAVAERRAA